MHRRAWLRALGAGLGAGVAPWSFADALSAGQGESRARARHVRLATNGDEAGVPGYAAMYSKGLPHDSLGFVAPAAYEQLARALGAASAADLERVPLGGTLRLVSPQAAFAFGLDGPHPALVAVPPPPSFASEQAAQEAVGAYWAARLRDVPFTRYEADLLIARAVADDPDLAGGRGAPAAAFRLPLPGVADGPYVSQFLLRPVPMGAHALYQRIAAPPAGLDHLTTWEGWLAAQHGVRTESAASSRGATRYMMTGRDLAAWTRHDYPAQAGLHAALILEAIRAPVQAAHPYLRSRNQSGYVTFGLAQVTDLASRIAMHALRAAWFHKWAVHRRLRPEAFGGRVEGAIAGSQVAVLPHQRFLQSQALAEVRRLHGSALLPQAFAEGSPLHPAYPAGHAAVVGASVTVLKAYYAGAWILPSPVTVSADGRSLENGHVRLTVDGELNKLASNVAMGRVFAGVQWRSDVMAGLVLGEQIALSLLRELKGTVLESAGSFEVTRFDGRTDQV
jgi:hypothetical protein